jgi:REP element-mobilizing transposase RayT
MARKLRKPQKDAIYHLIAKGNQGDFIFDEKRNKAYFLECLETAVEEYQALVYAFCIMGNHYHIILQNTEPNLSEIMHYVGSSFATYLRSQGRIGHIFSGRYKSICLEGRERILYLSKYIHLNPVRAAMVDRPEEYDWSSYRFFAWEVEPPEWLYLGWMKERYEPTNQIMRKRYREFVENDVFLPPGSFESRMTAKAIIEGERFLRDTMRRDGEERIRDENRLDALHDELCRLHGIDSLSLTNGVRPPRTLRGPRAMFIYIAKEYTFASHAEIAGKLGGLNPSAVAHQYRDFLSEIERDDRDGPILREEAGTIASRFWTPHAGI